jgi:hypothetical protein
LHEKYNLFYSETEGSFPAAGYKENGWYNAGGFVALSAGNPLGFDYPAKAKTAYMKVVSTSPDVDSLDELKLQVYTSGEPPLVTGEVLISTNVNV